jgi:hypothetical protein
MPVYRRAFPKARLVGVDISSTGIERCREMYGQIAEFIAGDHTAVPHVDIIIASNVCEHLTHDEEIAAHLLARCDRLFVIVPYRETIAAGSEHVNHYDENSFPKLCCRRHTVFAAPGWSEYGQRLWYQIWLKNIGRKMLRRPTVQRSMQVLFEFTRESEHCETKAESVEMVVCVETDSVTSFWQR